MWDLIVSVPDHCLSFYFVNSPKLPTWGYLYRSVPMVAGGDQWLPKYIDCTDRFVYSR